jgi:hypothetical protein
VINKIIGKKFWSLFIGQRHDNQIIELVKKWLERMGWYGQRLHAEL